MKRFLSALLTGIITMLFVGCSGNTQDQDETGRDRKGRPADEIVVSMGSIIPHEFYPKDRYGMLSLIHISRVKELGMDSAAITDHGVMYGVIDFYREAKKQGINPILGCEVYVAPGSRFDREISGGEDRYYHLVLLAENNTGCLLYTSRCV